MNFSRVLAGYKTTAKPLFNYANNGAYGFTEVKSLIETRVFVSLFRTKNLKNVETHCSLIIKRIFLNSPVF